MGIPSFFSYIIKNHNTILKKFNNSSINIHNLYIDSNSIIYDAVNSCSRSLIETEAESLAVNACAFSP